eukprot:52931_1
MSFPRTLFVSESIILKLITLILTSTLIYSTNSSAPILNVEKSSNSTCDRQIKFTTLSNSSMSYLAFYVSNLCCGTVTVVEVKDHFHYANAFVRGYESQAEQTVKKHYWIFDSKMYANIVKLDHEVFSDANYQFIPQITVRVTNSYNQILTYTDIFDQIVGEHTYYDEQNFNTPINCTDYNDSGNSIFNLNTLIVQILIYIASFYLYL